MNVKQGDLAIQIKSLAGNEGKIVKVLSFLGENPVMHGSVWARGMGPSWLCEFTGKANGLNHNFNTVKQYDAIPIPDAWLRPISGLPDAEEIQDENLIKDLA